MGCSSSALSQMEIPAASGWDGHESEIFSVKAVIPFPSAATASNDEESPVKQALLDTAQLENAAGAGYRLQAIYSPMKKGVDGALEPLESVNVGVNAMCFFQRAPHASQDALESVSYSTAFEPFQEDASLPEVYSNLKRAKETNFPVSYIVAEPQKSYPHTGELTAHVICQRAKGSAPNMGNKKYSVAVCKKDTDPSTFLAGFSRKGMRIASIFRPPSYPTKDEVHFIFESAPRPYHMAHVDIDFATSTSQINHSIYVNIIENAAAKGWQLAGIIDMLNGTVSSNGKTFSSTIRLVFQAERGGDSKLAAPAGQAAAHTGKESAVREEASMTLTQQQEEDLTGGLNSEECIIEV